MRSPSKPDSEARSTSSGRSFAGRSPSPRSSSSSRSSTTWRPTSTSATGAGSRPGALLGGLSWLALSGLFALYTSFSESYSRTYGALASGVVLLLWLNYSAFALLFGAELNSELDREAEIYAAGGPDAGLVKPSRRGLGDHHHRAAELRRAPVRVEDERAALQREPPDDRRNLRHARLPIDTRAAQVEVVQLRSIAHGDHVRPGLERPRPRAGHGAQRDRGAGTDGRVQPDRRGSRWRWRLGRYRRRSRRAS